MTDSEQTATPEPDDKPEAEPETLRPTALRCFMQFNEVLINVDGIDNVQRTDHGFICYMRGSHVEVKGKGVWDKIRVALGFTNGQATTTPITVIDKTGPN